MKPKRTKKTQATTVLEGNWIDVEDLVKPGKTKEVWPGVYVSRAGVVLDPPEPIKKPGKGKPKKKSA
jgi:hypothetical protein